MRIIKNMFKKKDKSLINKFSNIEIEAQKHEMKLEENVVENSELCSNEYIEEEIFWWDGQDSLFESAIADEVLGDMSSIITRIKKTELFFKVGKYDSTILETILDKDTSYILLTWNSSYLELSERRKFIELIKRFQIEFRNMGLYVTLVHNHKRLGLSDNIGVKVMLNNQNDEVKKVKSKVNGEKQV